MKSWIEGGKGWGTDGDRKGGGGNEGGHICEFGRFHATGSDTAPTASTVQQGRSAGLPAGKEAFNGEDGHHGGSLFPGGRSLETCRRLKSLSSGLVAGERRPALFYEPYSFPSRMRISVKVNFQWKPGRMSMPGSGSRRQEAIRWVSPLGWGRKFWFSPLEEESFKF